MPADGFSGFGLKHKPFLELVIKENFVWRALNVQLLCGQILQKHKGEEKEEKLYYCSLIENKFALSVQDIYIIYFIFNMTKWPNV